MPQIAQQDYFYVDVPAGASITEVFPREKATEMYKSGTIFDVIFRIYGSASRIGAVDYDVAGGYVNGFTIFESGAANLVEY